MGTTCPMIIQYLNWYPSSSLPFRSSLLLLFIKNFTYISTLNFLPHFCMKIQLLYHSFKNKFQVLERVLKLSLKIYFVPLFHINVSFLHLSQLLMFSIISARTFNFKTVLDISLKRALRIWHQKMDFGKGIK